MPRCCRVFLLIGLVCLSSSASATPFFARTYGMKCGACHSGFPRLNAFGLAFKANNFRIPGAERDAPLAWQKTVPLAAQVKPTIMHIHPGGNTEQFTDTQVLSGGLLTKQTAYYIHHTYFFDDKSQPFPSWELWAQQVLNERHKIMLKAGQFELPYAYSPEINRTTVSIPSLFFDVGLGGDDVLLGSTMSGLQISGTAPANVHWYLAGGAPAFNQSGVRVGERQFFGRFRDVFLRGAYGPPDRQAGLFAYFTSPPTGPTTENSGERFGLDGAYFWQGFQFQGMAVYGENSDPLNDGHRGVLRGAFIEADRMYKQWVGLTARLDVATTSTSAGRSYQDAKTLAVRAYPFPHLKLIAEVQWLDHGGSSESFMASIAF